MVLFRKLSALRKDLERSAPALLDPIYSRILNQLFRIIINEKPTPTISHLIASCFALLHGNSIHRSTHGISITSPTSPQFDFVTEETNDFNELVTTTKEEPSIEPRKIQSEKISPIEYNLTMAIHRCHEVLNNRNVDEWGKLSAFWCICWSCSMIYDRATKNVLGPPLGIFLEGTPFLLTYLTRSARHDTAKTEAMLAFRYFIDINGNMFSVPQMKTILGVARSFLDSKCHALKAITASCIILLTQRNNQMVSYDRDLEVLMNTGLKSLHMGGEADTTIAKMIATLLPIVNHQAKMDFNSMFSWPRVHLWKFLSSTSGNLSSAKKCSVECYIEYIHGLGSEWLENHFSELFGHFGALFDQVQVNALYGLRPIIESAHEILNNSLLRLNSPHLRQICVNVIFQKLLELSDLAELGKRSIPSVGGQMIFLLASLRESMSSLGSNLLITEVSPTLYRDSTDFWFNAFYRRKSKRS